MMERHTFPKTIPCSVAIRHFYRLQLGATIGRIANRIDNAKIKSLNEVDYQLTPNEGENVCHSGPEGFHHRLFEGPFVSHEGNRQTVQYTLKVKHLEDNFPGTIKVSVKYHVEEEEHPGGVIAGKLGIEYQVDLLGDAEETAIAMTNHRFVDLNMPVNLVLATSISEVVRLQQEPQCNLTQQSNKTWVKKTYLLEPSVFIRISNFLHLQHLLQLFCERLHPCSTSVLFFLRCLSHRSIQDIFP
jgi:galactose mutarotase-like enzyme